MHKIVEQKLISSGSKITPFQLSTYVLGHPVYNLSINCTRRNPVSPVRKREN